MNDHAATINKLLEELRQEFESRIQRAVAYGSEPDYRARSAQEHAGWILGETEMAVARASKAIASADVTPRLDVKFEYTWAGTDDEGEDWILDEWFVSITSAENYAARPSNTWIARDNGVLMRRIQANEPEPVPTRY